MNRLLVELGGLPVGTLRRVGGDTWEFRFIPEYLEMGQAERPVLGQVFLDEPERAHRATSRLPRFFSNLLPEGVLRDFLARETGTSARREPQLLAALGDDLPGAVTVRRDDEELEAAVEREESRPASGDVRSGNLTFSLSGVHLKLSARHVGERWRIPERGRGGDWIVKFPVAAYPRLPENEHAVMTWARTSGIEVPETRLIHWREIENLPAEWHFPEPLALAVRRFDRPAPGVRVHQEDFAQVLNLYPEEKYDDYNYETLAARCLAIAGPEALDDLVQRLVFMVLSGNGDAHHKNWSLIYPDGRRAALSPAYDLVFTRVYAFDKLALNFGRSKDFHLVGRRTFRRLAERLGIDAGRMLEVVDRAASKIREAWRRLEPDTSLSSEARERLRRHLGEMGL